MSDKDVTTGTKLFSTRKNKFIVVVICLVFIVFLEAIVFVCRTLDYSAVKSIISGVAILIITGTNVYMCEHKVPIERANLLLFMILEVLIVYMQICFA